MLSFNVKVKFIIKHSKNVKSSISYFYSKGAVHPQPLAVAHAAPVAIHAQPLAVAHAAPVAYHAQPQVSYQAQPQVAYHAQPQVSYQVQPQVAYHAQPQVAYHAQPLAVTHSVQTHAPVLAHQAVVAPQVVAHSALQPVYGQQQVLSHGISQQVLGHGIAHAAPLAQSYSSSSVTNHGVHGAYVH